MARVSFVLVVIMLGVIVISAGGVTPAHAVNCGDILGPGGNFKLQQTWIVLNNRQALTVRDGANLDLNGHIVSCNNIGPCILLSGVGAQLFDGVVGGSVHENVSLQGTGHTVENVTSGPADLSVRVIGDNNSLINVMASGGGNPALVILGNNNQLSDSIVQCGTLFVSHQCLFVLGNGNRLTDNFIQTTEPANPQDQLNANLRINGNHNVVRRNRIVGFSFGGPVSINGIVVTGTNNDIRHNTTLRNSPFDLIDTNGDCAHNTWKFNTFLTADPACIQ